LVEIVNDEARKYRVESLLLLRRQILATVDFDQRDAGHSMIFSRDQFRCPQGSAIATYLRFAPLGSHLPTFLPRQRRTSFSLPPQAVYDTLPSPSGSKQMVVYRMVPDPNPRNLTILDVAQSPVTPADPNRPNSPTDRLEVERRMARVIAP
jgi:hypothetical protein